MSSLSNANKSANSAVESQTNFSSSSPDSRTHREVEIIEAAKVIFAKRGYRNTDVQEIADAVGVGKGTIYRAFASKEELFYATVDHCMQRLNEAMQVDECPNISEIDAPKAVQRLETKILWFLQFFDANPEVVELLIQERSEFRDRDSHSYTRNWLSNSPKWRQRIQLAMSSGIYRQLPVDGFIEVVNDLLYGAIFTHYFSREKVDLTNTAKLIADIFMNGVLSEAGRQTYLQIKTETEC